jgi:HD-GYP domain-containing protein (c-di-GMP phosphodiesterase class II)
MGKRDIQLTKTDQKDSLEKFEEKVEVHEEKEKEVDHGVRATRSLIQDFLQAVKAYRLYEEHHPILLKFMDRLRLDFDRYFTEFDSFLFQIGEYQLFYKGKVVYENMDVKESLAFFFYKDGVRELQFIKGLELREIIDFFNIVRKSDIVSRLEDDLATLLWEKDFSHITFLVMDEFLEEGGRFVPATEEDLEKGLNSMGSLIIGPMGLGEEGGTEKQGIGRSPFPEAESLPQALNLSPGESLVKACQLNPEEVEDIEREAQREGEPDYVYVLITNLIEILLHLGDDMNAYENLISYFVQTIKSLLEQGEIGRVVTISKDLNDTLESIALKDKQIFAMQRILKTLSELQSVGHLGKAMQGSGEVTSESILQYLQLLTKESIEPLCSLLGELGQTKWKKLVSDRLSELGQENIQPLSQYLSDPNPSLVSQILNIFGRIGDPNTPKYLGHLVVHQDPKLRGETLQVLSKCGKEGKDLVQKFLKDPVSEIRAKASLILARIAKGEAAKPLMEIVHSENFYKRDYEEKSYFFRALGETGSKAVIPLLKEIANTKKWIHKAKWDEMRLCATHTLKMMGAEENSKNEAIYQFFQEGIQVVNTLIEREGGFSLKIIQDDLFLNDQRLRYSVETFPHFKYLMGQWRKRLIGEVFFKGTMDEKILKDFTYALFNLEEGRQENANLLNEELARLGIFFIEVVPLETYGGEGTLVYRKEDKQQVAKRLFFEMIRTMGEVVNQIKEGEYADVRRLKRLTQKAVRLVIEDETFLLGMTAIKNYGDYTFNHSVNVSIYSLVMGKRLGFSKKALTELWITAMLHDLGNSKIPAEILNKTTALEEEEWDLMKKHPLFGVEILLNLKQLGEVNPRIIVGIFDHHLKTDLSGYPKPFRKKEVGLFGRVLQIADSYDAMTTSRTYRKAPFTPEQALAVMLRERGVHFDPILLKIFIGIVGIYPIGSLVLLDNHEIGIVYKSNPEWMDRPQVIVVGRDEGGEVKKELVDLTETDGDDHFKWSIVKTLDPRKYHIDIAKYFL